MVKNVVAFPRVSIILLLLFSSILLSKEAEKTPYEEKGFYSYQEHCGMCHSTKPPEKAGPPLIEVLEVYKKVLPDSSEFVSRIFKWVKHPNPKSSLMMHKVIQHNIMPKLPYTDQTIRHIAEWMWRASSCPEVPDEKVEPDLGAC